MKKYSLPSFLEYEYQLNRDFNLRYSGIGKTVNDLAMKNIFQIEHVENNLHLIEKN